MLTNIVTVADIPVDITNIGTVSLAYYRHAGKHKGTLAYNISPFATPAEVRKLHQIFKMFEKCCSVIGKKGKRKTIKED